MIKMNVNEAWIKLFDKYDILHKIQSEGVFYITANQIKEGWPTDRDRMDTEIISTRKRAPMA